MPVFKYTVANKEGKKLSGTVEAPSVETAKQELNNLGFSILTLEESFEAPVIDATLKKFHFEAVDKNSKLLNGTIPCKSKEEAFNKLSNEYNLSVTAVWEEGAEEKTVSEAREEGTAALREKLIDNTKEKVDYSAQIEIVREKEEAFTKLKIEDLLVKINGLLAEFDNEFDMDKKAEINKKIDKLLRIKNSKNLEYILHTAEDLLIYIEAQEKSLKEKGFQEKRLQLQIKSKDLLNELYKTQRPESLSQDILNKIKDWEENNKHKDTAIINFLRTLFKKVKEYFETPPEVQIIKNQIKIYNKQMWEFAKMYFKEPTSEYRSKVINSIKTIYRARQKAVHSIKVVYKLRKDRKNAEKETMGGIKLDTGGLLTEINTFSGYLLGFYLLYYFISLYITSKDFGLEEIPAGFYIYNSSIFKYAVIVLFLFHSTTAIKTNFFKKSKISTIILFPSFVITSLIVLLNL